MNPIFDSETVVSIELGFKALVADGRGMINIAVFDQTLDDFQANSFNGLSFTVRNDAKVTGSGIELDYSWRATDSLTFSCRMPNFVSDFLLTGTVAWIQPISGDMNLVFSTDYRYRTDYHTGQDLDPRSLQDDLLWTNASLGVEEAEGKWAISAWVKNATDEEVYNIVFDTPFQAGSFHAFIEDPRMYGVTGTLRS